MGGIKKLLGIGGRHGIASKNTRIRWKYRLNPRFSPSNFVSLEEEPTNDPLSRELDWLGQAKPRKFITFHEVSTQEIFLPRNLGMGDKLKHADQHTFALCRVQKRVAIR